MSYMNYIKAEKPEVFIRNMVEYEDVVDYV